MHKAVTHVMRVGKILAPVDETGVIQKMQIQPSPFEILDSVNSIQLFGFASSPLPGADVVIVNVGGDNSNGNVIASNDLRHRPRNMLGGETQVYDCNGQSVYLTSAGGTLSIVISAGNAVNITAATGVTITAPLVTINGDLHVTGDVVAGTVSLKTHRHSGSGGSGTGGPPIP